LSFARLAAFFRAQCEAAAVNLRLNFFQSWFQLHVIRVFQTFRSAFSLPTTSGKSAFLIFMKLTKSLTYRFENINHDSGQLQEGWLV